MNTTIQILNLKCGGCANSIRKGVMSIEGVEDISVNLETSRVELSVNNNDTLEQVKDKLSAMGYPEEGDANTIIHKAKSFVSCATGRMTSEE